VIASFTGFAPINNPAVTILVSIDSPEGWPHGGGDVAAPVFKRIAEQVLPYMDVARDVPVNPRLVQTAYHVPVDSDDLGSNDELASTEPLQEKVVETASLAKKQTAEQKQPEMTVALDEGGDIAVPDFTGKTMREVTDICQRLGLNPLLVGSSLATQQTPEAGAKVHRGAKVTVEFGIVASKTGKAH
jgi:hypothetical protein